MIPFAPPHTPAKFASPEGELRVWFPAPGIAAAQILGYASGELARRAYELVDAQPVTPYTGFLDMFETTGFDWEARGRALKWNIVHLSPRMQLHLLVQTAPMLLASKVFQRALRDHVEVHTARASFDSAYTVAVRRRTRAPTSDAPRR